MKTTSSLRARGNKDLRFVISRRMTSRASGLALVLILSGAGCTYHAQPIGDVPLRITQRVSKSTPKSILILPFEDDRGDKYMSLAPSVFIPVVHLFHDARDVYYPDHGLLTSYADHMMGFDWKHRVMLIGSVASSMPTILAHAMKSMGLTDTAYAAAWSAEKRDYDYVLVGHLRRTHFRHDSAGLFGLFVLGPLGIPMGAAHYDLQYEVTLLDGHDRKRVIFTRVYDFHDKTVVGMWYRTNWAYRMFMHGLDATVPKVVNDVAVALASDTPAMTPVAPGGLQPGQADVPGTPGDAVPVQKPIPPASGAAN